MKPIFVHAFMLIILSACNTASQPGRPTLTNTAVVVTSTATETPVVPTETPTTTPTETMMATPTSEIDKPIALNFKDLEALPSLALEQFSSDEFNKQIIDRDAKGMYPEFSPNVVVLTSPHPITLWNQDPDLVRFEQRDGVTITFEYNFTSEKEWKAWKKPERRQYQVVERYQIPIPEENRTDYGVVISVLNPDGTHGFWKDLYIPYPGENVGPNLRVQYDFMDPARLPSPAYFRNAAACKFTYTKLSRVPLHNVDPECNTLDTGKIPRPFVDWSKTGKLNNIYTNPNGSKVIEIPLSTPGGYRLPSQWNP